MTGRDHTIILKAGRGGWRSTVLSDCSLILHPGRPVWACLVHTLWPLVICPENSFNQRLVRRTPVWSMCVTYKQTLDMSWLWLTQQSHSPNNPSHTVQLTCETQKPVEELPAGYCYCTESFPSLNNLLNIDLVINLSVSVMNVSEFIAAGANFV